MTLGLQQHIMKPVLYFMQLFWQIRTKIDANICFLQIVLSSLSIISKSLLQSSKQMPISAK